MTIKSANPFPINLYLDKTKLKNGADKTQKMGLEESNTPFFIHLLKRYEKIIIKNNLS